MTPPQILSLHHGVHAIGSGGRRHQLGQLLPHQRRADSFDDQLAQRQAQAQVQDSLTGYTSELEQSTGATMSLDPRSSDSTSLSPLRESFPHHRASYHAAAKKLAQKSGRCQTRPPGIDARRMDLPKLQAPCVVQVVDCAKDFVQFRVFDNSTLGAFLEEPRPVKSKLRYIHVNGLSWDVIKPLALKFDLHRLSLEDMARSKADYFRQHLFVSLLMQNFVNELEEVDGNVDAPFDPSAAPCPIRDARRSHLDEENIIGSPDHNFDDTRQAYIEEHAFLSHAAYVLALHEAFERLESCSPVGPKNGHELVYTNSAEADPFFESPRAHSQSNRLKQNERRAARWTVAELTKEAKVRISVEQLSVFLLDSTVISFSQDPGFHPQVSSVFDRMASQDDLIRDSEQPSMVLQALIDVVVDDALVIVDEFRDRLTRIEATVLAHADDDDVRRLHILSSQLLLLKSTFSPLQLLISSLRTQDEAKYAATLHHNSTDPVNATNRRGWVTHQARLYLGDVLDHIESVLGDFELFSNMSENLISYAFNMSAQQTNSYMQALSVLSSCFLPLTFLSGYFGMNASPRFTLRGAVRALRCLTPEARAHKQFERFPHVLDGDVSYFWIIAVPVSAATVILFSW
ncbi:BZ3500_MvSof-1268-A1-R1_Chr9g10910 [Microbotryum saponariae]|uniref:BZ3500_MvSof-1268-A1-R1_Chr9g10910 protein n=1 Tax=Microbotryum saponariae TaxID=289078 RepID=A0A2X0M9A5_9BASI|nr:BZ3501_MvSof-1269-A2-R1_Chr9g10658 [Microbotryum saponariae]SDA00903.1 BZ3500_MvSof-1268-A1-R1_Chr9g10910 [Microbotryum saponariae]